MGRLTFRLTVLFLASLAVTAVSGLQPWNGAYSRDEDYPGINFYSGERDSDYPDILKLFSSEEECNKDQTQSYYDPKDLFSLSFDPVTPVELRGERLDVGGFETRPWLKSKYRGLSAPDHKTGTLDNDKNMHQVNKHGNLNHENKSWSEGEPSGHAAVKLLYDKQSLIKSSNIKQNGDLFHRAKSEKINKIVGDDKASSAINRPLQKKGKAAKIKSPVLENKAVISKNTAGRGSLQSPISYVDKKMAEDTTSSDQIQEFRREKINQVEREIDEEFHQMKIKTPDKFHRHQMKSSVQMKKSKTIPGDDGDYVIAKPSGHEAEVKNLESKISEDNENYQSIDSKVHLNLGENSKGLDMVSSQPPLTDVSLTPETVNSSQLLELNGTNSDAIPLVYPIPGDNSPQSNKTAPISVSHVRSDILARPPIKDLVEGGKKSMNIQPIAEKSDRVESKGEGNPSGGKSENKTAGMSPLRSISSNKLVDNTKNKALIGNMNDSLVKDHILEKKSAKSQNSKLVESQNVNEGNFYSSIDMKLSSPSEKNILVQKNIRKKADRINKTGGEKRLSDGLPPTKERILRHSDQIDNNAINKDSPLVKDVQNKALAEQAIPVQNEAEEAHTVVNEVVEEHSIQNGQASLVQNNDRQAIVTVSDVEQCSHFKQHPEKKVDNDKVSQIDQENSKQTNLAENHPKPVRKNQNIPADTPQQYGQITELQKAVPAQRHEEHASIDKNNTDQTYINQQNTEQTNVPSNSHEQVLIAEKNEGNASTDHNHVEQESYKKSYAGNDDLFAHPLTLEDPELSIVHEPLNSKQHFRGKPSHKRRKLKARRVA